MIHSSTIVKSFSEVNTPPTPHPPPPPPSPNTHMHTPAHNTLQGSITFAYQCVEKLYAMFEGMHLKLAVLENHFEPTFRPHIEAPVEVSCRHHTDSCIIIVVTV